MVQTSLIRCALRRGAGAYEDRCVKSAMDRLREKRLRISPGRNQWTQVAVIWSHSRSEFTVPFRYAKSKQSHFDTEIPCTSPEASIDLTAAAVCVTRLLVLTEPPWNPDACPSSSQSARRSGDSSYTNTFVTCRRGCPLRELSNACGREEEGEEGRRDLRRCRCFHLTMQAGSSSCLHAQAA